jgi:hypothetical protein
MTYDQLAQGGIWAVPRSGLVFQKISTDAGPVFRLVQTMPHMQAMPISAEELVEYQREDLQVIKEKFQKAGITVEGEI